MESTMNTTVLERNDSLPQGMNYIRTMHKITVTAVLPTLTPVGIIFNIINCVVFIILGMKDSVSITLFSLSLLDLASLSLMLLILAFQFCLDVSNFVYGFMGMIGTAELIRACMYDTMVMVTVFLAIQRCLCVALPFKFQNLFGKSSTIFILLMLFAIVVGLYSVALSHITPVLHPAFNMTYVAIVLPEKSADLILSIDILISIIIPFSSYATLFICMWILIIKLKMSTKFRERNADKGHGFGRCSENPKLTRRAIPQFKPKHRLARCVTLLLVVFAVCNLPDILFTVVRMSLPQISASGILKDAYTFLVGLVLTFQTLNSSLNIFIYYFFNSKFRQVINNFLSVCINKRRAEAP